MDIAEAKARARIVQPALAGGLMAR